MNKPTRRWCGGLEQRLKFQIDQQTLTYCRSLSAASISRLQPQFPLITDSLLLNLAELIP